MVFEIRTGIVRCVLEKLFQSIWEDVRNQKKKKKFAITFSNAISFSDTSQTAPAEGWVISSESCGFLSIGARYEREVLTTETFHYIQQIDISI